VDIRIRSATPRDWLALAVLMRRLFPADISPETARGLLLYHLHTVGVAEAGGRVIGFYQFHATPTGNGAWLNFIGLDESARRGGAGTLLLRAYEAQARSLGYRRSVLDVYPDNGGAMRFYERLGYAAILGGLDKLRYVKELAIDPDAAGVPTRRPAPPGIPGKIISRLNYWWRVELPLARGQVRQC